LGLVKEVYRNQIISGEQRLTGRLIVELASVKINDYSAKFW